jgi:hypothetical protein
MERLLGEIELLYQKLNINAQMPEKQLDEREMLCLCRKLDEIIDRYIERCDVK